MLCLSDFFVPFSVFSALVFQLRAQWIRQQGRRSEDPESGLQQPPAAGDHRFHLAGPPVTSSVRPMVADAACDPMAVAIGDRRQLLPAVRQNEGGRQVAAAVNAAFERFIQDTTAAQPFDEVVAMASFADRKGERQADVRVTLSPPRDPPPVKKRTAVKPASHRLVRDSAPGALPHEIVVRQLPAGTRYEPPETSSGSSRATDSTRGSDGSTMTVGEMAVAAARALSGGGPRMESSQSGYEMGQTRAEPTTSL